MVDTILPLVEEAKARAVRSVAAHTAGATIGGAAVGAWLGLMGAALLGPFDDVGLKASALGLAAVAAVYALSEAGLIHLALLERKAQVPEDWRRILGIERGVFVYGLILGAGFLTFVSRPTMYLAFGLAFASMSPALGAAIGAVYGVSRAIPVAATVLRGIRGVPVSRNASVTWAFTTMPHRTLSSVALTVAATYLALVAMLT